MLQRRRNNTEKSPAARRFGALASCFLSTARPEKFSRLPRIQASQRSIASSEKRKGSTNQSSPLCSPPHLYELRIHAAWLPGRVQLVLAESRAFEGLRQPSQRAEVGALGNFPDWRASSSLVNAKGARVPWRAAKCGQDRHSCCGTIDSCCMISWRSVYGLFLLCRTRNGKPQRRHFASSCCAAPA